MNERLGLKLVELKVQKLVEQISKQDEARLD
jgi:hypothetical protein